MKNIILFSVSLFLSFYLISCAGETSSKDDGTIDHTVDDTISYDETINQDPDIPLDPDIVPEPPVDLRPDDVITVPDADVREDGGCTKYTGDSCTSPAQCDCIPSAAKQCLTNIGGYITFNGGYCSAQCTSTADCGPNANCAAITTGTNYCLKPCSSASQCRMSEGYTCTTIPMSPDTRTYCLPPMTSPDGMG